MEIIVCLDDRGGMLFNNRRQSKDGAVLADIKARLSGVLTIDAFSEKLISQAGIPYEIKKPEGDCVFFAENVSVGEIIPRCTRVVIYKWNRAYPFDLKFDADLAEFSLKESTEFAGTSHDKITREVYER